MREGRKEEEGGRTNLSLIILNGEGQEITQGDSTSPALKHVIPTIPRRCHALCPCQRHAIRLEAGQKV